MPEQMSADFEQVMAQCSRGCFTGLLRVRTREGNGEVRFLSGIQDGIRFDSVEGDAALERLLAASDPEFEAISSLPPIAGSSDPLPTDGALERYHAAQLMRYCESNSLTCALELEVEGRVLTARYRLGELLSVEPDSEHTARLAEAKEGLYRFRLPRFELPANVQQRRSASIAPKPAAAPAPAAAAKPAAAKSAASLAETPLVAMKAVPVGAPPASTAKAPAQPSAPQSVARAAAPAAKSTSSPPRSVEPRPAAPAPRFETPSNAPPAVVTRREEPRAPAAQPARPAAAALAPAPAPAAARVAPSPAPAARPAASPAAARRDEPAAPRSPAPPSGAGQKPLEGLWVDAVKPPPQSAPLELEHAPPSQAGAAQRGSARAEGLSSLAYKPAAEPAKVAPSAPRQQRSSSIYWVVAILLLLAIAAAGWFFFGR